MNQIGKLPPLAGRRPVNGYQPDDRVRLTRHGVLATVIASEGERVTLRVDGYECSDSIAERDIEPAPGL